MVIHMEISLYNILVIFFIFFYFIWCIMKIRIHTRCVLFLIVFTGFEISWRNSYYHFPLQQNNKILIIITFYSLLELLVNSSFEA